MELHVTAPASKDSFGARGTLNVGDASYEVFRLSAVEGAERLPFSLKILLALSVLAHVVTALTMARRKRLTPERQRRIHRSVFCHMVAIVILANTEVSARAGALWRLVLPVTSPPPPDSNAPKPKAPAETPAPSVQGPPAEEMATTLLKQMQAGTVDRKLFDPEFNWYLTDAKVREAAPRLAQLGDPVQTTVLGTSERGGLEVSVTQFAFASGQKVNALMYRAPDGIVHQYLLLAP